MRTWIVAIGLVSLSACASSPPRGEDIVGTYGFVTVLGGEELHLLPGRRYLVCEYADEPFADTGGFVRERRGTFTVVGPLLLPDTSTDEPATRRYFIASKDDLFLVSERAYEAWQAAGGGSPNACCGRRPLAVDATRPRCGQAPGAADAC